MNKKIFNKVTLVTSPRGNIGKTTIANNLAYLFAKDGYITGVIELDRQCGTSPYIHSVGDVKTEKSLKTAMTSYDEDTILKSFIQSKHHDGLFTLSLRHHDEVHSLYKFSMDQIQKIIKIARKKFDKVIIDAPMSYIDNGFIASLNIHPDQVIQILDEDFITWQKLKLYEDFLDRTKMRTFNHVFTIINKDQAITSDKIISNLKGEMKILKLDRVYRIPYLKRIIKANNEGTLLADMIPASRPEKSFVKALRNLYEDIININLEDEENPGDGKKGKKTKFFSFKLLSKKKKKDENIEKGESLNVG